MSEAMPKHGNRSDASVGDYLLLITRGYTLNEIADRYGVTNAAVHKMLKRHGLPTCALDYLRWLRSGPAVAQEDVK